MWFYEVFGGVLRSDIEFPELRVLSAQRPDWTLRSVCSLAPLEGGVVLGEESLFGGVNARLERGEDQFRLRFDDTGTFDISADGSTIDWMPGHGAEADLVRSDVLGRVLSIAMHAAGDLCVHASAVAIGEGAVVVLGEKGHGKSTLTMALLSDGARFVADDTTRLTIDPPQVALGVPWLRLRTDAAARFGVERSATADGDKIVHDVRATAADAPNLRLEALYVLVPRSDLTSQRPVMRRRLTPIEATLTLVKHGKCAALLGKQEAGLALGRASALARQVPVYALDVKRDLTLLGEVATELRHWHEAARESMSS
jgi:hypothetical protein